MNAEFMEALSALAVEKGISTDTLLAALADALESAYKRMPGAHEYAWVIVDPDSGDIRVFAQQLNEDGEPVGDEFDGGYVHDHRLQRGQQHDSDVASSGQCVGRDAGGRHVSGDGSG